MTTEPRFDGGNPAGNRAVSPSIQAVIAFIEANFAEPLALGDLAALCGLSLHRFVTVFRCQVGIPPHQYVCRTRVYQAQQLLRQGVPAAAVAVETGFCDQSHLSRHFKRHCGTTPSHFAGRRSAPRAKTGPDLSRGRPQPETTSHPSQRALPCA